MDRIRAGLTGLGAVFLVTAAASLLFAPDDADRALAEQQAPGEPLAQLGVAPGSDKGPETPPPEPAVPTPEAQPSAGPFGDVSSGEPLMPTPTETISLPLRDQPVAI
jgi:hypothetical protein